MLPVYRCRCSMVSGFIKFKAGEFMRDNKLVVAQIGCGAFARAQHLPNVTEHKELILKYCCDVDMASAEDAAKIYGAEKAVGSYEQIMNDSEVDLLMVATPHDQHLPIVKAASLCGKHVFCEKPMAMNIAECQEIIRYVKRGNIKLCVDLNRRMAPSMHALREKVIAQRAEPVHSPWRYVEVNRELFPEEKRANLLMRVQDESSSYRMIHLDPAYGGGLIIGESVHWLDLACWFFAPQVPVEINAWGSSRLSHGINLTFSNGDTATLCLDVCGTFDYPKEMYEVTAGAALFRHLFFVENNYYGMGGMQRETFPLQSDGFAEQVSGEGFDAFMEKCRLRNMNAGENMKESYTALTVDKGHRRMLAEFVKAIQQDLPSPCDEYAGLQSTLLAKLAIKSIKLKRALPVPIEELRPAVM